MEDVNVAYQVPNMPPQVGSVRITANPDPVNPTPDAAGEEPVLIPGAGQQGSAWDSADHNTAAIQFSLFFRRGGLWVSAVDAERIERRRRLLAATAASLRFVAFMSLVVAAFLLGQCAGIVP